MKLVQTWTSDREKDGRIITKFILRKIILMMWTWLNWFRYCFSGGIACQDYWKFLV